MPHGKPSNRFAAKARSNKRQADASIIAAALLILAGVASTAGTMYFYAINEDNENVPSAEITNLSSGQVVAGPIEIRGSATGEKGSTRAIMVQVDGGPAVSATPKAPDDFSSWSAVVDVTTPGKHTIEVQVVDGEGKVYSKKKSLTVTEPAPTMTPPPDQLVEATGAAGAEVHYSLPVVEGDLVGPTCSPASGQLFPLGITTVNCVATHGNWEALSASFTVSVHDSTPPAIQAPADVIGKASGEALTKVSLGLPVVSDIVDANPSVSNDAPSSGFPPGTTSVVWTATDDHGNFATAVQMVTVLADIPAGDSAKGDAGKGDSGTSSSSNSHGSNKGVSYGKGGGGGSSKSNNGKDKEGKHNDKGNPTAPSSGGGSSNTTTTTHYSLVANSVDLAGKPFSGMYTTIKSTAGDILAVGYTPMTFTGTGNATYTVTLSDNATRVFDHWENGATTSTRTITLSQNITIAAYYHQAPTVPSDTTPPVVTAFPLGGTYSSSRSVALSANEPATIYFTTDGTTPTTSSAVYTSAIDISSTKTLKYFAKDASGNEGTVVTQVYVIDTIAPTVTALLGGGTYPSAMSVALSSSEPAIIYYTTNGKTPNTFSQVYGSPVSISSTTTLKYFAIDEAGNRGEVVTQVYVINTVDKTRPSVLISQPAANSDVTVTGGEILVTGTASDSGSGIKLVEVRVDNNRYMTATPKAEGDWSSWGASISIAAGHHRLVSRATDNAGNLAWNRINITVHTSNPPPPPGSDFNFGAAGDWGDTGNSDDTARKMADRGVELAVFLGDFSYGTSSSEINNWWYNDIAPLHGISVAALGNHDDDSTAMMNQYHSLFELSDEDPNKDWLYSFNYQSVHFLAMNTEASKSRGSDQYKFVQNDLAAAASNPNTTWIVVLMHRPPYTSPTEHGPEVELQKNFHPLFDQYGVDLVLYGHNHNYQRTYPLKHNPSNPASPIIETTEKINYKDPQGQVYVTAGIGGQSHYALNGQAPFVATQDDKNFGFINIDIINDGKTMKGTFYTNGGTAFDKFTIDKSSGGTTPPTEDILRTGDATNDTFDSVILAETSAVGWPDPMLIKAQISQESDFNPSENTLGTQWASPCGLKSGWTKNESQSFGLLQITPACGDDEDDMGLYPAGTPLAGHPILVSSKSDPYWSQSFYKGEFNIHFGMYIMSRHFAYYENLFPGCTENQYMLMALAAHIDGRDSVSGCGSWASRAQEYIDHVLVRYHNFSEAAGYPERM